MEWKPIETAPKDGTEIIGYNGETVRSYAWIDYPDDVCHVGWCYAGYSRGGGLDYLHNVPDSEPTHWTEFPNAPRGDE